MRTVSSSWWQRLPVLAVFALGCSSGEPPMLEGPSAASTLDAGAAGMCADGETQPCGCRPDGGGAIHQGRRSCYMGQWLDCNCSAAVPPPPKPEGECKAGRYEGEFSGIYTSGFTVVGAPIPIYSLDLTGQPGLSFTLNEQKTDLGQEFSTYTISDGHMSGTADGLFPVEGVLTGTLDCATKKFTGTLRGGYCVTLCAGVNEAEFEGPVVGYYDGEGFKFTSGTWDLVEIEGNSGLFGAYGGNGEWSAHWVGEASVDVDAGQTTVDAGVPDAGP